MSKGMATFFIEEEISHCTCFLIVRRLASSQNKRLIGKKIKKNCPRHTMSVDA